MEHSKEEVEKAQNKGQKDTETCVCNMEWRGTHDDEWGDCLCSSDGKDKAEEKSSQ